MPFWNAQTALAPHLCSQIALLRSNWVQLGAILGHAQAILRLSWERLGVTWFHIGAWSSNNKNHIPFWTHCWSMYLHLLLIKPMVVLLFWNRIVHRNSKNTLLKCQNIFPLHLCNQIVFLGATSVQHRTILGHVETIWRLSLESFGDTLVHLEVSSANIKITYLFERIAGAPIARLRL